jgi:predicted MFS family arabinose efflux permease
VRPAFEPPEEEWQPEPPGGFMEGFRVVGSSHELRGLLALDAAISLLGLAGFSSTVAFLEQELHVGAHANGWLLAATGLAGALGSQIARPLSRLPGVYAALAGAIGVTYLLVPQAASLPAMMAMWALRGAAIGAFGVLLSQRLVVAVPKEVMGRVNAAWILAAWLAAFAGSAITPFLLRTLGGAGSFRLYGVLMLAVAAAMLVARALGRRPEPTDTLDPVPEA